VQSLPRGRTTIIEVSVAEEDMGKVIGKGGRNIEAIRAVVRAAGLRKHERVQVELPTRDGMLIQPPPPPARRRRRCSVSRTCVVCTAFAARSECRHLVATAAASLQG